MAHKAQATNSADPIEDEGEELADRVFFLGVAFVLIALVACIAAGLLYRAASRALFGSSKRG